MAIKKSDLYSSYWKIMPGVRASLFATLTVEKVALPATMHSAYAETHFCSPDSFADSPAEFAIITAHATTGEKWTDAQNTAADEKLEKLLLAKCDWLHRITGYSPSTLHAEPGWAAALSYEEACDIGTRFKQDAIYFVRGGTLSVSHCDQRRKLVKIAPFLPGLHLSTGKPVVRAGYATPRMGELDRVSQTLIRQLAERYATPLPKLTDEVAKLAAKVDVHLRKMGANL